MGRGRLLMEGSVDTLTQKEDFSSMRIDQVSSELRDSIEHLAKEHGGVVSSPSRSLEELFLELAKKKEEE